MAKPELLVDMLEMSTDRSRRNRTACSNVVHVEVVEHMANNLALAR